MAQPPRRPTGGRGDRGRPFRFGRPDRPREDLDVIPGRRPVWEALRNGRVLKLYVSEGASGGGTLQDILSKSSADGVPTERISEVRLDAMAGEASHQGVLALARPIRPISIEDLVRSARDESAKRVPLAFVLDGIEDPQNVGAVLRVADGAGALGVVIPRTGAAGLTAGAVRASAGAVEHVRVASVDNLPSALVALKKARFRIVGTSAANGPAHSDADLRGAVALVLGSEGRGVSAAVERACDSFVRIPLLGALESLNVSTAAAVLAFEKRRQDGSAAARPGASVPHAGRPPARNREAESSPLESTETGGAAGPVTDSETP